MFNYRSMSSIFYLHFPYYYLSKVVKESHNEEISHLKLCELYTSWFISYTKCFRPTWVNIYQGHNVFVSGESGWIRAWQVKCNTSKRIRGDFVSCTGGRLFWNSYFDKLHIVQCNEITFCRNSEYNSFFI